MAENVLYADLNLSESTRPRILTVSDVPGSGCTYAEVKVKAQDTNAAANCKSSGKSHCSRKHVAILVVIILILILAVYLIITHGPTANSPQDSTTTIPAEALGCPPAWKKHGRKCYFFFPEWNAKDWNGSRAECTAMGSDLVVIDSREELSYLLYQSRYQYYLLGLTYSPEEQKWKWINNVELDPAMFNMRRPYSDYDCVTIGFGEVGTAPCGGSPTTQNMCEKAATIPKRHLLES
ncbi:natural killer cells antigen CD94-like isoform 5-T5 [Geothlypis trichas]